HNSSSLDFTMRVWAKKEDYWTIFFDLQELVKKRFDQEGIEIPYNKLDVYQK
ncbi:MAG: mechanosensitive ion channel family protein, partial [Cetobacterium sp.]